MRATFAKCASILLIFGLLAFGTACGPDAPGDDGELDLPGDTDPLPPGYNDPGDTDPGNDDPGDTDPGNEDPADTNPDEPGTGDPDQVDNPPGCTDPGNDDGKDGKNPDVVDCNPICPDPICPDPICPDPLCPDLYCPDPDCSHLDCCREHDCDPLHPRWCEWKGDCRFDLEVSPLSRLAVYWTGLRLGFQMQLLEDMDVELLAKAPYDECYAGVGEDHPDVDFDEDGNPICPEETQPKRNQAYVWGLTKVDENIYFGTAPNVHCLVMQGFLGIDTPIETDDYVCEMGGRDFRPPRIYRYDTDTNELTDISPETGDAAVLLSRMTGLRSAGSIGDVAFLAGPGLHGVHVFAYRASTGELLGAQALSGYTDVRQWLVVKDRLYLGVGLGAGVVGSSHGELLLWTGDVDDPETLFDFVTVGEFPGSAANLAYHEGRIFVGTWPGAERFGLFMSRVVPCDGALLEEHAHLWEQVWNIDDYEPDDIAALSTGGGALISHDGFLYWGTMHVPGRGYYRARRTLDLDTSPEALAATYLGTHRAISVFRGKDFGTCEQKLQIVYGEKYLPVFDEILGTYTIAKSELHRNRMECPVPLWGPSGLGNFYNNYTWAMNVFDGDLYIGTMDFSYLAGFGQHDGEPTLNFSGEELFGAMHQYETPDCPACPVPECSVPECPVPECPGCPPEDCPDCHVHPDCHDEDVDCYRPIIPRAGADLFRIYTCDGKAATVFADGVRNPLNYGVRTMVSDAAGLYLGMANPMNIAEDGGWELLRLTHPEDEEEE